MTKTVITSDKAPAAIGTYSQAIKAGNTVYMSGSFKDIVKLNIFLTDLSHFAKVNEIMGKYFEQPYPARAAIGVAALPKGSQVEMDAILVIE